MHRRILKEPFRRGAIAPMALISLIVLLGMVAFAVDTGYIALARSQAQNSADAAALAGSAKLAERLKRAPIVEGIPIQTADDLQLAREEAKAFARRNAVGGVAPDLNDDDIEIGYLADPYDPNDNTLQTSGWPDRPYNAVRVKVARNDQTAGGALNLFFAPILGVEQAKIKASATSALAMGTMSLQASQNGHYTGLLPFTYQIDQWNALLQASGPGNITAANGVTFAATDSYTVNSSAIDSTGVSSASDDTLEVKLYPGRTTSGNFGTVNFSFSKVGNSTNVLRDLILNGPTEEAWPDLPEILEASLDNPLDINGDPGLSAGMESAVQSVIGRPNVIPLYSTFQGQGNNTYYRIVGFAPVTITAVSLQGSQNGYIIIQPRVITQKTRVTSTSRIVFSIDPSDDPNPLFVGPRSLVR